MAIALLPVSFLLDSCWDTIYYYVHSCEGSACRTVWEPAAVNPPCYLICILLWVWSISHCLCNLIHHSVDQIFWYLSKHWYPMIPAFCHRYQSDACFEKHKSNLYARTIRYQIKDYVIETTNLTRQWTDSFWFQWSRVGGRHI